MLKNQSVKIDIDPAEPECVRWVGAQVWNDLRRVNAAIRQRFPARIVAGTQHPLVRELLRKYPAVQGPDAFVIDRVGGNTLVVAGPHFRGVMFGLLELSRRAGIDPLEYFTDAPPRADAAPWRYPLFSTRPAFRYRGFFINEEDLLATWKNPRGPIPLEVFDAIYLTILRLGGNLVLPGTFLSTDSPILERAARRGLILAQHHFQVVGTDVARLTAAQKRRYSFVRFPAQTAAAWRRAIRRNRRRETVWTLGYRGCNDRAFWFEEPGIFSDREKGRIISRAMQVQWRLLHEELGQDDIPAVFYLYRENQLLYQQGLIRVPPGVSVVWCDNGHGTMESYFRDGYELWGMGQGKLPPGRGKFKPAWPERRQPGSSLYYHVAFYDSCAPNRTQYVAPGKIQENFCRAQRLGLDYFLLVNVGNMREFVLGITAAFDFARAPRPWLADRLHHRAFLEEWCARHFGGRMAKAAAAAYAAFYDAHVWWRRMPGKCLGDNAVRHILPDMMQRLLQPNGAAPASQAILCGWTAMERTEMILGEGAASLRRWRRALAMAERLKGHLAGDDRRFLDENLVIQCRRALNALAVLVAAAQAVVAVERHESDRAREQLARADRALKDWEAALAATDRAPKWSHWSRSDHIVLPGVVRRQLQALRIWSETVLIQRRMLTGLGEHIKLGTNNVKE